MIGNQILAYQHGGINKVNLPSIFLVLCRCKLLMEK